MGDFRKPRFGKGRFRESDRSGSRRDGPRFGQDRPRFGRDRSRGRDSGEREMHTVTCDKCGIECEVPFKPSSNKPIFCDNCFKSKGTKQSSRSDSSSELAQINAKLDKIIRALKIEESEDDSEESEDDSEEFEEESEDLE